MVRRGEKERFVGIDVREGMGDGDEVKWSRQIESRVDYISISRRSFDRVNDGQHQIRLKEVEHAKKSLVTAWNELATTSSASSQLRAHRSSLPLGLASTT